RPADARSDLYGLGALLYEMETGRPPFAGDDALAVISQHLNTPPIPPLWQNPEIPPALEDLVMQLLAKAPAERPASAAEVARGPRGRPAGPRGGVARRPPRGRRSRGRRPGWGASPGAASWGAPGGSRRSRPGSPQRSAAGARSCWWGGGGGSARPASSRRRAS